MTTLLCRSLRDKYERIRALRVSHDRAANDDSFIEPDPKLAMQTLADEFPGALRELDRLSFADVDRRLDSLRRAEEDPTCVEGWMLAQYELHRFARGALAVKRWLSQNVADELAFRKALPTLREEAALFATQLEEVAEPPRGRIMDLVYERAAGELGISERQLRKLLQG